MINVSTCFFLVKGTIECLRLCVNVDYLLLLYEFFVEGLPKRHDELDNPIAEQRYDPDSSKNTLTVVKKEHNLSESSGLESSSSATTLNVAAGVTAGAADVRQRVVCELRVEYPQFILYEDQYELKRSNSLIVDGMFHVKIDLDDERIKVHTMLNDLMVRLKSVRAVSVAKRVFKTSKRIIVAPTSLSLSGEMDNRPIRSVDDMIDRKAQSFILDIQDINFNMSPQVLNTSLKMMATIQNSLDQVCFNFCCCCNLITKKKEFFSLIFKEIQNGSDRGERRDPSGLGQSIPGGRVQYERVLVHSTKRADPASQLVESIKLGELSHRQLDCK